MTQTSIERSRLEMAVEMTISDLIREDSKLLGSGDVEIPILFQALDRPCLRYCAASIYKDSPVSLSENLVFESAPLSDRANDWLYSPEPAPAGRILSHTMEGK
ncbi:hypothetical protein FocTR4_00000219 [Fusarium oxysporum f. sp. cubense]|nr:hypothetical protein FocTR4_00000219 [Fusarium oxysporum f. sp. cubense]